VTISTIRTRACTVLVVEDDAAVRDACTEALVDEGYAVHSAADGLAALAELGCAPDVVVLDLVMPRMDGWEFLRRLRALPDHERTPVLLLTATASTGAALAGAQAILRKPFVLEALLRHVSDLAG
jgi:two-component system response regulator MprA